MKSVGVWDKFSVAALIKCDFQRLLHGDEKYEFSGLIFAGDQVTLTTTIVDFYDKKGGALEFVTLASVLEHVTRGVLVRATRNLFTPPGLSCNHDAPRQSDECQDRR